MHKYNEFYTCKRCGNVFYDICLSCKSVFCGDRIICPNCRSTEKREKKKYLVCPECGAAIVEEIKIRNLNLSAYKYCTNCGNKIADLIKAEIEMHKN